MAPAPGVRHDPGVTPTRAGREGTSNPRRARRGTRMALPATRAVMGTTILDFLAANPLVLLFLVAAIGYPIGQLRVRGSSLGVAAVLFVGLGAGAVDPRLAPPGIVYM